MVPPLSIIENYIKPSHWSVRTYPGISARLLFRTDTEFTSHSYTLRLNIAWCMDKQNGVYSQIFYFHRRRATSKHEGVLWALE